MEKSEISSITAVIEELFNFLYSKKDKHYFVNINWALDNTNISIKEQFENNKLLDIDVIGQIDVYNSIVKKTTNLVMNNNDVYGYLTTTVLGGSRRIDSQVIKTHNLEINLPIYSRTGLIRAEAINNMMFDNMEKINEQNKIKQKIYMN